MGLDKVRVYSSGDRVVPCDMGDTVHEALYAVVHETEPVRLLCTEHLTEYLDTLD